MDRTRLRILPHHIIAVFACIIVPGCMTPSTTVKIYADPSLSTIHFSRVVAFPIVHSRLTLSDEQKLYGELLQSITTRNPGVEIVDAATAVRMFNEKSLAGEWASFIGNRDARGLPDSTVLRRVGKRLGVDAVIQGDILDVKRNDGIYGKNRASTSLKVRYYIMGVESGKLLWEGSTDGVLTTFTPLEQAPPFLDVVEIAHKKVLETLPF